MRLLAFALLLAATASIPVAAQSAARPGSSRVGGSPELDARRPIASRDNVWIEQLTWMEVRDAIRSGMTTAVVPTGGVEQNGPYLATGKHNVILRATAEAVARRLGDALVAPIVPFVPEGSIEPPSGPMAYPGTISVEPQTFKALLRDIARSLRAHGFTEIVFIGDSGGNQEGMEQVSAELNQQWAGTAARVLFIPEYYDWPGRQRWLVQRGYLEVDEGIHDELSGTAIMLSVDPNSVRRDERIAAGRFAINGIELAPSERTSALGRALVEHVADVTVQAITLARGPTPRAVEPRRGVSLPEGDDAERAAIMALRADHNRAIAAGDAEGIMRIVADDHAAIFGRGRIIRSKEELRRIWTESPQQCVRTPRRIEIGRVEGVRAAESGDWQCDVRDPARVYHGSYFAHWSRQGGNWRVVSDTYVSLGCRGDGCSEAR